MAWTSKDKDRAVQIAVALLTLAGSLGGAWLMSGAAFDRKLKEALDKVATAERDVAKVTVDANSLQQQIQRSFRLVASCNAERTTIAAGEERPILFPACAERTGVSVDTPMWKFTAPTPGLYHVATALRFEDATAGYLALYLRTSAGRLVLTGQVTPAALQYAPTISGVAVVKLAVGETLWLTLDQLNPQEQNRTMTSMSWIQVTQLLAHDGTVRGAG